MTIQSLFTTKSINKRIDLVELARTGIKTKYISAILKYTALTENELISILPISQRQLIRYDANHKLNKEITSHLIQLIELFQKGINLFGQRKFNLWIRTPNKVLGKNQPLELMDTSIGIEMIEEVIGRIQHGVYS